MSDHDTWNMFAAAAAQGMLASTAHPNANGPDTFFPDPLAKRAAEYADALLAESKKREPAEPTPPQPDDDGWIDHDGAGPPFPSDRFIELKSGGVLPESHVNWYREFRYRIATKAGVTK